TKFADEPLVRGVGCRPRSVAQAAEVSGRSGETAGGGLTGAGRLTHRPRVGPGRCIVRHVQEQSAGPRPHAPLPVELEFDLLPAATTAGRIGEAAKESSWPPSWRRPQSARECCSTGRALLRPPGPYSPRPAWRGGASSWQATPSPQCPLAETRTCF